MADAKQPTDVGPDELSKALVAPLPFDPHRFNITAGVAPAQGGELKNIRRCLRPAKPEWAMLTGGLVASLTGMWNVLKDGTAHGWGLLPAALAIGAAAVVVTRFTKAWDEDLHLKAAQEDADRLIALQAQSQAEIDRALVAKLAAAASQTPQFGAGKDGRAGGRVRSQVRRLHGARCGLGEGGEGEEAMSAEALLAVSQWARIVVLGALLVAIVVFVCWLSGAQNERRDRCRAAGGTYLVRENLCLDGVRVRP